jgi:hypothetical protein
VQNQPSDGAVELTDEPAPDPDLRAARHEIRAVADGLRAALAADDQSVTGDRPATEGGR